MYTVDIEIWLGTMSVSEFTDTDEIYNYFEMSNLQSMWPGEEIDKDDAHVAMLAVLNEFEKETIK